MEKSKALIIEMIGEEKYNEEMDVLKKMKENEDAKGAFTHIEGDVDDRPEEYT